MDLSSLNATLGQPGRIAFLPSAYGGPVAELTAPSSRAVVALRGAQVLSFQPRGMDDVLWAAPKASLMEGKAFRGGVPVCWPWFGNHPTDASKPAHGFARTAAYSITSAEVGPRDTMVQFVLEQPTAGQRALWPYAARLCVTVRIGEELDLTLETTNLSATPMPLTQALHTYLRVGDVGETTIEGLEGCQFLDTLTGRYETEQNAIRIDCEIDRIYSHGPSTVQLLDHRLKRCIQVTGTGSASTIVWNPWIAKSQRLSDMAADDYRQMVCIETANAADDARTLAPGSSHTLSAAIKADGQ